MIRHCQQFYRCITWKLHKTPIIECQQQILPGINIMAYFLRFSTMLSGRLINRWWKRLPEARKREIVVKARQNSEKIGSVIGLLGVGWGGFYLYHLEPNPVTGRRRFVAITAKDLNNILEENMDQMVVPDAGVQVPSTHPSHAVVNAIVRNIVSRNSDKYPELKHDWRIVIVDNNDVINACCLPTGLVIVYSGLLNFVENQHQLAHVIAHEMSHVLLEHSREKVSRSVLLSPVSLLLSFLLYTVIPADLIAIAFSGLKNRLFQIFLELPYDRMLEVEADVLGVELASRACFRVQECSRFWEIMAMYENSMADVVPGWLSTHPKSGLRAQLLQRLEPEMTRLSRECGCQTRLQVTSGSLMKNLLRKIM